ncbi:MAG: hypothetical protein ABSE51_20390, partial [Terracidiphilus sp.]
RSLHPRVGQPHAHSLRRQLGKVTYPRLAAAVNHAVARMHTVFTPSYFKNRRATLHARRTSKMTVEIAEVFLP